MKVLLDTHAFLWLITGDKRLSRKARTTFLKKENRIFLSAVSLWEICIKLSLDKLSLKEGWIGIIQQQMKDNSIDWLPIEMRHCIELVNLPFHHRDPFDRMLIAQAMVEKMQILSRDARFADYPVKRVW